MEIVGTEVLRHFFCILKPSRVIGLAVVPVGRASFGHTDFAAWRQSQKNIEVYIADSKKTTPGWRYGFASGHYPPIAMYFPQLIDTSNVLK